MLKSIKNLAFFNTTAAETLRNRRTDRSKITVFKLSGTSTRAEMNSLVMKLVAVYTD